MLRAAGGIRPRSLSYLSTSYTNVVNTTTGAVTYTYTGVNLGTPASNRYILGVVYFTSTVSGALTIDSASIGGVSGTSLANFPSLGGFNYARVFLAAVPSGSTGTVSYTRSMSSGGDGRNYISLYVIYSSSTPTLGSSGSSSGGTTSNSITLTGLQSGDEIIATSGNNANTTHTYSPAGFTTNFNFTFTSGTRTRTTASLDNTTTGSLGISCTYGASAAQGNMVAVAIRY
jgi:hypothetical protein